MFKVKGYIGYWIFLGTTFVAVWADLTVLICDWTYSRRRARLRSCAALTRPGSSASLSLATGARSTTSRTACAILLNGGGYGKLKIGLGLCLTSREAEAVGWSPSDDGSLVPRWFDSMMRVGMMGEFFVVLMVYREDGADDSSLS